MAESQSVGRERLHMEPLARHLRVRTLGRVEYAEAADLQHFLFDRRAADEIPDHLLLLEHPHVFTMGRRTNQNNLLLGPAGYEALGATVVPADRGGDVTYHGPGQLVAYPIVKLRRLDVVAYVRALEEVVIRTAAAFGVTAGRTEGLTGVWVDEMKLAAIGVRVSRRTTMHGLALNVSTDLDWFSKIVPCGIPDRGVTSLSKLTGIRPEMGDVAEALVDSFVDVFGSVSVDVTGEPWTRPRSLRRSVPKQVSSGATGNVAPVDFVTRDRRLRAMDGTPRPDWMRVRAKMGTEFRELKSMVRGLDLHTVCEEAGCPNIFECWSDRTATLMILGSECTRACGFCKVSTGRPTWFDYAEPRRVAEAVRRMRLTHAVITGVARDDLVDGGASAFAETVRKVREVNPGCSVEVLIPDFKGDRGALEVVLESEPDVLNHNLETVARLQRSVRHMASYARSLTLLARTKALYPGLVTKSGLMVGIGEREVEVEAAMADLASVGVEILTIGQYLSPSASHIPVSRWWTPEEFAGLKELALSMGFSHVESGPLVRSSYHAKSAVESVSA